MPARHVIRAAALSGSLATALLLPLGCSDQTEAVEDGALRGELAVYIVDNVDGRSHTAYALRDAQGNERTLLFDKDPELASGVKVRVLGVDTPDGLRVTSFTTVPDPTASVRVQSPLIGAAPYPARSFAMVIINLNGNGVNITNDAMVGELTGNADSIKNYYLADSYGMQDISAQVFGPINYSLSACSNSDASKLASDLRPMIQSQGTFQHYLWYIGSRTGSPCTWGGLGSVGNPQSPARDTWYNASTSCVVLVQEPGHNFGMQHSSSMACGSSPFADDPNTCTYSEYGDRFDPMGGGCRHMNAWQKWYQGWFGGCNGVKITSSGTFTLLPFEPQCNGVQFLQIKAPKARPYNRPAGGGGGAGVDNLDYYYLELRTPVDFDGMLGNTSTLSPRVLVHVAAAPRSRTQTGLHTYLLDMNPATTGSSGLNDAGLVTGQTFNDPGGGLTITAQTVSAQQATIVVSYTAGGGSAPTCLDGSTFETPGPSDCSMGNPTGAGGRGGTTGGAGTSGRGGTTGTAGTTGGRGGAGGRGGTTGGAGNMGNAGGGVAGTNGGVAGTSGGVAGTSGGVAGTSGGVAGTSGGVAGTNGGVAGTSGGVAGTNGVSGTFGTAGTFGIGGTSGGEAGTNGAAGTSPITGAAGNLGIAGVNGAAGSRGAVPPVIGGCSCEIAGAPPPFAGLALGLSLFGIMFARRRRP